MSTRRQRIDAGVEWLDKKLGEAWPGTINLDVLDLGFPSQCVLGQTMGWEAGTSKIYKEFREQDGRWEGPDWEAPSELGFNVSGKRRELYPSLTDAWRTKIRKLKRERGIADGS